MEFHFPHQAHPHLGSWDWSEEASFPGLVGSNVWCEVNDLYLPLPSLNCITVLIHKTVVPTTEQSHDMLKSVTTDLSIK